MKKGVFIDLETGGLDPRRNAILEIGAVAFERFDSADRADRADRSSLTVYDQYSVRVTPDHDLSITPRALNVNGFEVADAFTPANGVDENEAFAGLIEFLREHLGSLAGKRPAEAWGPRIWSHNAGFDFAFLAALEERLAPGVHPEFLFFAGRPFFGCTRALAQAMIGAGVLPADTKLSLIALADDLKTETGDQHHRAMGDAMLGVAVLDGLLRRAGWLPQWKEKE